MQFINFIHVLLSRYAQEQLKTKECQWIKEKEEFSKNLKCKESLLDRLTNDRNDLEARCITHLTLLTINEFLKQFI